MYISATAVQNRYKRYKMSKARKIFIAFLIACMSVCISVAVAACGKNSGNYPDYKNPTDVVAPPGGDGDFNGTYNVKISSKGGLQLNGVEVGFRKNGVTQLSGISRNGQITVNLKPDVYELVVNTDSLPAGYYVPDGEEYKTSAEDGNVEINLPSKVVSMSAPSDKSYSLGDVMYDFSYTPANGSERKTLSELVENNLAVMINFWYEGCGPCRSEFPAIEQAYNQFKDKIAIVALSSQDTATAIKNFQAENGYTFDMARDTAGIEGRFSVGSWPTTIIVDRFGVVVYRSSGAQPSTSVWSSLFAKFTSFDYVQDPVKDDNGNTEDPTEIIFKDPPADTAAPDYRTVLSGAAVLGEGAQGKVTGIHVETGENDKDTSWPWYVETEGDTSYLYASNSNATPTYAILYIDFSLKSGDILSYDVSYKTAASDAVYVILDSTTRLATYTGGSADGTYGWETENGIYLASRDINITLSFTYIKYDIATDAKVENDFARIGNISVTNVEDISYPFDFARSAAYLGLTLEDLVIGDDGFYHVRAEGTAYDNAILLTDLWKSSDWSINHAGGSTFNTTEENTVYPASMYYFSFWEFSNYQTKPEEDTGVTYDYTEYSEYLNTLLMAENYSKNGYVPVTPTLIKILEDFCLEFRDSKFNKGQYYDGEWLEMCYVFEHHNGSHANGTFCSKTDDPIYGLTIFDAIPAVQNQANYVNIDRPFSSVGGHYYKFTAPKAGVYKIYSRTTKADVYPEMFLYGWNGKHEIYKGHYQSDPGNALRGRDFVTYRYLTEGEDIYMMMYVGVALTGDFNLYIEYAGESYNWLCTAAFDGAWTGIFNENGELAGATYNAIPWALREDGYYYTYSTHSEEYWGSVIYIDFLNINYHDMGATTPRTLLQLIEADLFNLKEYFEPDYTATITSYYYQSIADKDENDELYGKIEASEELVSIIAKMLEYRTMDGDALNTGFWLSMAYYYRYIGA